MNEILNDNLLSKIKKGKQQRVARQRKLRCEAITRHRRFCGDAGRNEENVSILSISAKA